MDRAIQLKELRKAIHLAGSQTKLAKMLGTTRATVNSWLNNEINIPGMQALNAERIFCGKILAEKLSPNESAKILVIKQYFINRKR